MKHLVKFATVAAMAAGLTFAQTAAPAQPQSGKMHAGMRGAFHQRMMAQLNLTDAQKAQAKTIFQQAKQTAKPIREQLKQNREALSAAVKANDTAQIHSLSVQRGKLEGQMLAVRSEAQAKFYSNLTPDQRAKADQMRQQFKTRIEHRMKQRKAATNG
jgi:periplasmic protein CpxP/Spy